MDARLQGHGAHVTVLEPRRLGPLHLEAHLVRVRVRVRVRARVRVRVRVR